jgi:hypoxanthine phosphoribosyltransferase
MKRRKAGGKRPTRTPDGAAQLTSFSAARIASRVTTLGKEISKAYRGKRLDVVVTLDRSFIFAADLVRQLDLEVVCHFVREDVKDVEQGGRPRREVFFGNRPELSGRDVLLVDAILESGVTQEFLLRRLADGRPRSLRLAVLLDKPGGRRVDVEPDYFGLRTASKGLWVGYGLVSADGTGPNRSGLSSAAAPVKRRKATKA